MTEVAFEWPKNPARPRSGPIDRGQGEKRPTRRRLELVRSLTGHCEVLDPQALLQHLEAEEHRGLHTSDALDEVAPVVRAANEATDILLVAFAAHGLGKHPAKQRRGPSWHVLVELQALPNVLWWTNKLQGSDDAFAW
jgi:hypothetical protein